MSKWFKINNDNFTAKDISIQFSIDTPYNNFGYSKILSNTNQTFDITISVEYNQTNSNYFFNLFDKSRQPGNYASDYKFDISSGEFMSYGCIIKSISSDPTTNLIVMDIISDYSSIKSLEDRRDEVIDIILNETSKNK